MPDVLPSRKSISNLTPTSIKPISNINLTTYAKQNFNKRISI